MKIFDLCLEHFTHSRLEGKSLGSEFSPITVYTSSDTSCLGQKIYKDYVTSLTKAHVGHLYISIHFH